MSLSILKIRADMPSLKSSCLSLLALTLCAPNVWGAVPAVYADAQQTLTTGLNSPQAAAGNFNNQSAIFIADTNNNQVVIRLTDGRTVPFLTPGFTLSTPQALAMDAQGDLFIGDTPTSNGQSYGRIIEMTAANGNLTDAGHVVFSGAPLTNPISLAVDSTGTLFIGDYPSTGNGVIYSLAPNATTLTPLTFTGLSPTLVPAALLRDSSTNLYIADNGATSGGVYTAPDTGGAATSISTPGFVINQPSGVALDAAGNLYILSILGNNAKQQVTVIPAASPTTPYIIPNTGIGNSSAMLFDAKGNLDVLSSQDGALYQLTFGTAINMGYSSATAPGAPIIFNFELNATANLRGFSVVTAGDVSTELTQTSTGTCTNGRYTNVSPSSPYTCELTYQGTSEYPGLRNSAILVKGGNQSVLASVPVYQIGVGGVQVTYPLASTTTAGGLQEPQAVAISGLNKTVYVADTQAGQVFSIGGLGGTTLTPVSTGAITLVAPSALAVDGAGNLFIADYGGPNVGQVVEVSPTAGVAPVVLNTGGLLQHPIALTLDSAGNLYIGDAGSGGFDADAGNPGFLVKVPVGGTAFKLNTPTLTIIFPQALVSNFYTGNLYVGDAGESSGVGQVDVLSPDGTVGSQVPLPDVTNPAGLTFDPAGNLYVLDGYANTITVDPIYLSNPTPYLLQFDTTKLTATSAMAMSAGGQSLIIANIGTGTNNSLVYVNGNTSTLDFGNVPKGTQSQALTATVANIGNTTMTLGSPYYASPSSNAAFSVLNSSTCTNNLALGIGGSPQNNTSCNFNFEFTPTAQGATKQKFTINSNAYNHGVPVLTVQGTGTPKANVPKAKRVR